MVFSIVIPCHNDWPLVCGAVDACLAQQGDVTLEVIVVDDGSTDGTHDALLARYGDEPQVKLLQQANAGPGSARNHGVSVAMGEHLLFLDADDRIGAQYLAAVKRCLVQEGEGEGEGEGECAVLSPFAYFSDEQTQHRSLMRFFRAPRLARCWVEFNRFCLMTGNCFPISACVLPRQVFDAVGGFDASMRHHEDWDLWIKVVGSGVTWVYTDGDIDAATHIRMRQGLMSNVDAMKRSQKLVISRHAQQGWWKWLNVPLGWWVARAGRALVMGMQLLTLGRDQHLKFSRSK
jgi:glycosyltransferase involved in cell wall biosynthesis